MDYQMIQHIIFSHTYQDQHQLMCVYMYFLGLSKSRTSSISSLAEIDVGDRVIVAGQRKGTIKFVGDTKFAPGKTPLQNMLKTLQYSKKHEQIFLIKFRMPSFVCNIIFLIFRFWMLGT